MSRRLHASTTATIRYQKNWRFFTWPGASLTRGDPEGVWMMVRAYRMHASRDEHSPWTLAYLAQRVAIWQCDAGRGAECAEFADKALVHAAAMPPGNWVGEDSENAADSGARFDSARQA